MHARSNYSPILLLVEGDFGDSEGSFEVEDNFEVVVNGDLVWSKKTRQGQGLPDTQEKVRAQT